MKKSWKIIFYAFSFLVVYFSCNREDRILKLLKSNNATDVIKGCNLIEGPKDSAFVDDLLAQPFQRGISHNLGYKGISIHTVKMRALKRISELEPPNEIDSEFDSTNESFYLKWAHSENLL